jgi:hypothetical protein
MDAIIVIAAVAGFVLTFALAFAFTRMVLAIQMPMLPRLPVAPDARQRSRRNQQARETARQMADEARVKASQRIAAARRMHIRKHR